MEYVDNLVVGCGLAGAVISERLATVKQEDVLIIDKREHIAGNAYDYKDKETGITVHKYGPHVFHTNSKEVFSYLSKFTSWHLFMYRVKAVIDGNVVNIPFNFDTLNLLFPPAKSECLEKKLLTTFPESEKIFVNELISSSDSDLQNLGHFVYKKVFLGYTVKMWGKKPEEIDPSVINRIPVYLSRDNRYFQDKYQAIPKNGYTHMVNNILDNERIKLRLNCEYNQVKHNIKAKRIIYTGSIDELYDYCYGMLPYRSLIIDLQRHDQEYFQCGPQINYPENYDFTRICEYKYYLNEKSDKTVISFEYPCEFNLTDTKLERFYPISNDSNNDLYARYKNLAMKDGYLLLGRLGLYRYMNMDITISEALKLFEALNK